MARLTEAIRLSEGDVISSARSDKWSIRVPRASLGSAMGRRDKAIEYLRRAQPLWFSFLAWARVECSSSVGSGLHRLLFVEAWLEKDKLVTCRKRSLVEKREERWLQTCMVMLKE